MSEVELREIRHHFGGAEILCGLNLRIDSGQYVVLLGPSGCGKTTTLRLIAGLQRPSGGSVWIGSRCVDDVPPRDRDVAMVFQNDALYPHLTVGKSIAFALGKRIPASEIDARVRAAAELAGAADVLDRFPDQLSGGELRRAAIAKAIVRRSRVRLMDEPLAALDAPLRHGLQRDLLRWHARVPGTTLHVTHDGQEAMRMADKIAVMEAGRIIQYGKPQQLYDHPQFRSVALAIGSPPINLLPLAAGDTSIRPVGGFPLAMRDTAQLGVRAHELSLLATNQPIDQRGVVLMAQIERITPIDGRWELQARVGANDLMALLPTDAALQVGQSCQLFAMAQHIHLFDTDSGARIQADDSGR
jgi:ABC-type sugar transport system ATPase subunit